MGTYVGDESRRQGREVKNKKFPIHGLTQNAYAPITDAHSVHARNALWISNCHNYILKARATHAQGW